jgi:hypothetical protein
MPDQGAPDITVTAWRAVVGAADALAVELNAG